MPERTTIENILLRGGPCDGDQLHDLDASALASEITVPAPNGGLARYRKTAQYEQLRGVHVVEPYSRRWVYEWLPDA